MKNVVFLIALFFAFQANANTDTFSSNTPKSSNQNVSQQTGGNYIYAENGKLTFNLEPSLFENRKWQFNQQYDAAVVGFETKLPIKTKNSSNFYAYELAMGYRVYEYTAATGEMKLLRETTEKPPKGELIYPVYTPRIDKGQTYVVWVPAAIWVVRVVGTVARSVLPPIITRALTACMASQACVSIVGGTSIVAAWLCAFNYVDPNTDNHDGSLCKKAKKEGWQPNTNSSSGNDELSKNYEFTVFGHYGNADLTDRCPECSSGYKTFEFGADSEAEALEKLRKKCAAHIGGSYVDEDESSTWYGLSGTVKTAELTLDGRGAYRCSGTTLDENNEEFPFGGFLAFISNEPFTEKMQIHDINDLIMEDFKSDPTPYINDNGQVGKELRQNIKSSAAIQKKDGTSGTLNATSEPYLDPETGKVKQDILTINSGTSDFTLPPMSGGSGGSSGGGGGSTTATMPTGSNNVAVSTIERPDLANEAKPAENNSPNGTGVGSNTDPNSDSNDKEPPPKAASNTGLDCSKNADKLACAGLGDVDEERSFEIPKTTNSTTWNKENLLPSNGLCPAPKRFMFFGETYEISYLALCRFVEMIRYIVIALAALAAGYIIFGRKD